MPLARPVLSHVVLLLFAVAGVSTACTTVRVTATERSSIEQRLLVEEVLRRLEAADGNEELARTVVSCPGGTVEWHRVANHDRPLAAARPRPDAFRRAGRRARTAAPARR